MGGQDTFRRPGVLSRPAMASLRRQDHRRHRRLPGHRPGARLALAPQRPRLVLAARDAGRLEDGRRRMPGAGRRDPGGARPTSRSRPTATRSSSARSTRFGGLDVLVNNAGIGMIARFDEVRDLSIYERLMRVNYLGCVYLTHHALPHLKKSRGQIVVDREPGRPHRRAHAHRLRGQQARRHRLLRLAADRAAGARAST